MDFFCSRRNGDEKVCDMDRKVCWSLFSNNGGWVGGLWGTDGARHCLICSSLHGQSCGVSQYFDCFSDYARLVTSDVGYDFHFVKLDAVFGCRRMGLIN
jgi:hypothetical protein